MRLRSVINLTALAFFILLKTGVAGQQVFLITPDNRNKEMVDLVSYICYKPAESANSHLLAEVIDTLSVNKQHTFFVTVRNQTDEKVFRHLTFGERYVTAKNIKICSSQPDTCRLKTEAQNTMAIMLLPGEEKTIYFDLKELNRMDTKKVAVTLLTENRMTNDTHQMHVMQSFFLGLFAFLCIFNLIIYFVTGWNLYLKYVIYIFCGLVYLLYYFGLLQQVFPSVNTISLNLVYTWYSIIFITYFIFLNDFGNYKEYVPRAHQLLNVGIVFKSTQVVFDTTMNLLGADFIYASLYKNVILTFEMILMGLILFYIIKNKNVRGRLVILASLMLIAGAVLEQLNVVKSINHTYFVEFGIAAELLTFSVGLGYITKLHYDEKNKNRGLYIEQLIENERIQKNINEQLEEKVKQRTIELEREKKTVEDKNKENELLLQEIHHRVKNNLQVISSLLSLQERSIENTNAKSAFLEGKERVKSMELVYKMLYQENKFRGIEMNDYVANLLKGLLDSFGIRREQVESNTAFKPIVLEVDTAIPLGLILNELIINSLKHAFQESKKLSLSIAIHENESAIQLQFSDNGNGKASDVESSSSFGLKIIKALVRQLEGTIEIKEDKGLKYQINIKNYKLIPQ